MEHFKVVKKCISDDRKRCHSPLKQQQKQPQEFRHQSSNLVISNWEIPLNEKIHSKVLRKHFFRFDEKSPVDFVEKAKAHHEHRFRSEHKQLIQRNSLFIMPSSQPITFSEFKLGDRAGIVGSRQLRCITTKRVEKIGEQDSYEVVLDQQIHVVFQKDNFHYDFRLCQEVGSILNNLNLSKKKSSGKESNGYRSKIKTNSSNTASNNKFNLNIKSNSSTDADKENAGFKIRCNSSNAEKENGKKKETYVPKKKRNKS